MTKIDVEKKECVDTQMKVVLNKEQDVESVNSDRKKMKRER